MFNTFNSSADAFSITPGASVLAFTTRGLLATVAGTVTVVTAKGTTLTLPIAAGVILPIEVVKVTAATATGLFGFV